MRLHYKENPKEWRKVTLLGLIGPSALIGILRWRGVVSWNGEALALASAALVALCAWLRPGWFRGYYRFTTWLGSHIIQFFGTMALATVFFLLLTPFGWFLRLLGKDLLQLKSRPNQQTYWQPAKPDGSLNRMY
jgi:hypothetical protein